MAEKKSIHQLEGTAGEVAPVCEFSHAYSADEVLGVIQSRGEGLSDSEASARLARFGPNRLESEGKISPWMLLLGQFKNVLIVILLIATAISFFLGHGVESIAIAVIVLFAVVLGFVQEYRAEKAIDALKKMAAPTARVVRDGVERVVPADQIVPGDVFLLAAGDRVPADARLLNAVNLKVEESSLTGESLPSEKDHAPVLSREAAVGDRKNMVFAGTAVQYGRGRALTVATGMKTEFGKIARLLQEVETEKTPLQKNLDRVGTMLARVALAIILVIVTLGIFRGQPLIEMLIFGIALAVAVVPEALPAVVTISLALGVKRMVKRNALIRRLPAVETLGSTTVICSDKTGTLTRDEMTVKTVFVSGMELEVTGTGYIPEGEFRRTVDSPGELPATLECLLTAGCLCNDSRLTKDETGAWSITGDPTEGALLVAARKAHIDERERAACLPRIAEIPFSSESKRMITVHASEGKRIAFIKGAPEVIIPECVSVRTDAGLEPLDEAGKRGVLENARRMAAQALRVIAIAEAEGAENLDFSGRMVFLGLVGMIDPPRPEAKMAVEVCMGAGIRPMMITGDHPLTAEAVARELGILTNGRVVIGTELARMGEAELDAEIGSIQVFARVAPEHKLRIVEALQRQGHVVAMTGDGVNDAPALKKANIGVAMGITGTDVSKEASAMMLTDDNFASIVAAVEEGRGIYDNIKKYLTYLLSSNIGEILLMVGATLLGMPLPLTAVQLLYVNLATDGLPALALAVDPVDPNIMRRKPNDPRKGLFTGPLKILMLTGGAWSALANLAVYHWARASGKPPAEAMTMVFVSLVLIQFFKAYVFRSEFQTAFRRPFVNKWLNMAIVWEIVLLLVVVYIPFLRRPFGTFPLSGSDWLAVGIAALTILPVIELVKWSIRRGWLGLRGASG